MKADHLEEQKWRGDTALIANTNLISWLSYFLVCIRAVLVILFYDLKNPNLELKRDFSVRRVLVSQTQEQKWDPKIHINTWHSGTWSHSITVDAEITVLDPH